MMEDSLELKPTETTKCTRNDDNRLQYSTSASTVLVTDRQVLAAGGGQLKANGDIVSGDTDRQAYRQARYNQLLAQLEAQKKAVTDEDLLAIQQQHASIEMQADGGPIVYPLKTQSVPVNQQHPDSGEGSQNGNITGSYTNHTGRPLFTDEAQKMPARNETGTGNASVTVSGPEVEMTTAAQLGSERTPTVAAGATPQVEIGTGRTCELRQKRHVIEEVVIESCEKFYEDQSGSLSLGHRKRPRTSASKSPERIEPPTRNEPLRCEVQPPPSPVAERVVKTSDEEERAAVTAAASAGEYGLHSSADDSVTSATFVVHYDVSEARGRRHGSKSPSPHPVRHHDEYDGHAAVRMTTADAAADLSPESQDFNTTYVVHHDMPVKTSTAIPTNVRYPGIDIGDGKQLADAPEGLINIPETVTYIVHHDMVNRMSKDRQGVLIAPSREPLTAVEQYPDNTVTYVVHYDVPTKTEMISGGIGSSLPSPGWSAGTTSGDDSRKNVRVVVEADSDVGIGQTTDPDDTTMKYVTRYEIDSATNKGGRKKAKMQQQQQQVAVGVGYTVSQPVVDSNLNGAGSDTEGYADSGVGSSVGPAGSDTSSTYIIQYKISPRQRRRVLPEAAEARVTEIPAARIEPEPVEFRGHVDVEPRIEEPRMTSAAYSMPLSSSPYDGVTYTVEYEILSTSRGKEGAVNNVPESRPLKISGGGFAVTGIPIASGRTTNESLDEPDVTKYVVEYSIQANKALTKPILKIPNASRKNDSPAPVYPAHESIETGSGAQGSDRVTFVVEYEIVTTKPQKSANVPQLKELAQMEMEESSGSRANIGSPEMTSGSPTSVTYSVDYEILGKPGIREPVSRTPQVIVTGETGERIHNLHAATEGGVQIQIDSTDMSSPESVKYVVEYGIGKKQNKRKAKVDSSAVVVKGSLHGDDVDLQQEPVAVSGDIDVVESRFVAPVASSPATARPGVPSTDSITYVVDYEVSSKRRKIKSAGVPIPGTHRAKVEAECEMEVTTPMHAAVLQQSITTSQPAPTIDITPEEVVRYVIDYEIGNNGPVKFKSPSRTIASASRSGKKGKKKSRASKGVKQQAAGVVEIEVPPAVESFATIPTGPVSITYTTEYDISSRKKQKTKKSETAGYTGVSADAGGQTPSIDVALPENLDVDVEDSAAVRMEPDRATGNDRESVMFVIEYKITATQRGKVKPQETGKDDTRLKCGAGVEMKPSTGIEETQVMKIETESLQAVLPASDVVSPESMTYVVQYEISTKDAQKHWNLRPQTTKAKKSTTKPTSEEGEVSVQVSRPVTDTVAVETAVIPVQERKGMTYVIDYEISLRKKAKVTKLPAVVPPPAGLEFSGDVTMSSEITEPVVGVQLDSPPPAAVAKDVSAPEVTEPDSGPVSVTYVVDYDISVRRTAKTMIVGTPKKKSKQTKKQDDVEVPTPAPESEKGKEASVSVRPVEVGVAAVGVASLLEPREVIEFPSPESITFAVEYEILKKQGTKKKKTSNKSEESGKLEMKYELHKPAPMPVITELSVESSGGDAEPQPSLEPPKSETLAVIDTLGPESVTYSVEYEIASLENKNKKKGKLLAAAVGLQGERSAEQDRNMGEIAVELPVTEPSQTKQQPQKVDKTEPEEVTYIIEYEIEKTPSGKKLLMLRKSGGADAKVKAESHTDIATNVEVDRGVKVDQQQPESLYLHILRVAAESEGVEVVKGRRWRGRSKKTGDNVKTIELTYITDYRVTPKRPAVETKARASAPAVPAINVEPSSEVERPDDGDAASAAVVTQPESAGEIRIGANVDVDIDTSAAEPGQQINVEGDDDLAKQQEITTLPLRKANDDVDKGISENRVTYIVDYDWNLDKKEKAEKRQGKIMSFKVIGKKGAKNKDVKSPENGDVEPEVVTYIVNYDVDDLVGHNASSGRQGLGGKLFVLTGKRLGKKYAVGKMEAAAAARTTPDVDVVKPEVEKSPADDEDAKFAADMMMVIESTRNPSTSSNEEKIMSINARLQASSPAGDDEEQPVDDVFETSHLEVSCPKTSAVTDVEQVAPAFEIEGDVAVEDDGPEIVPLVAAVALSTETTARPARNGEPEDSSVTYVVHYDVESTKKIDDEGTPEEKTADEDAGRTSKVLSVDERLHSDLSTPTSGFSETVTYVVDTDWSTSTSRRSDGTAVQVSPTSTIRADSPTSVDYDSDKRTVVTPSPPVITVECQDVGVEVENSPPVNGDKIELEPPVKETKYRSDKLEIPPPDGVERTSTNSDETVTYVVTYEQNPSPSPRLDWNSLRSSFGRGKKKKSPATSTSQAPVDGELIVAEKSAATQSAAPCYAVRRNLLVLRPIDDEPGRCLRTTSADVDRVVPSPSDDRHFVVVAVDFGTTFSGYAFSFTSVGGGPLSSKGDLQLQMQQTLDTIHVMRRWEGGDPGVVNHKAPTTLLLDPEGEFHSFGFSARDFYHDMSPKQTKDWFYFERFKMALHSDPNLNIDTELTASNGQKVNALKVFGNALRFFRNHALREISDQSGTLIVADDVKWVITVPAIWQEPAKQFMRIAAYQAGIASADNPDQLIIALEPEAASIYVRRLHVHQLTPDCPPLDRPRTPRSRASVSPDRRGGRLSALGGASNNCSRPSSSMAGELMVTKNYELDNNLGGTEYTITSTIQSPSVRWSFHRYEVPVFTQRTVADETDIPGARYMVVDCGGGTVDIAVHQLDPPRNTLTELYKATGGPFGSVAVDQAFEELLVEIFGSDFIDAFKKKRPAGWVDLMMAFESRKRAAHPLKTKPLNVSLPFSFIDYHKKIKNCPVESAVRRYADRQILWSSQGMLRLLPGAMKRLFQPTVDGVKETIANILNNPSLKDIKYMFLVGGFSESAMLQMEVRQEFKHLVKIIIPTENSLAILKGAVCFGVDSTIVTVRRSRSTYAVGGFVRPFVVGRDAESKRVDGDQCADALDVLVAVDQPVCLGETVVRRYTAAADGDYPAVAQLDVYRSDKSDIRYTSDAGVVRCGTLSLELDEDDDKRTTTSERQPVEIHVQMTFGSTEIRVAARDLRTGKKSITKIDFLSR